jgi:hypothetical protein
MLNRRNQNRINNLKSTRGQKLNKYEDTVQYLKDHLSHTLIEPSVDRHMDIDSILTLIPYLVTKEHNQSLLRLIPLEEVTTTISSMAMGKSPSPDGFTIEFFQICWSIIGEDVWKVVKTPRL